MAKDRLFVLGKGMELKAVSRNLKKIVQKGSGRYEWP